MVAGQPHGIHERICPRSPDASKMLPALDATGLVVTLPGFGGDYRFF